MGRFKAELGEKTAPIFASLDWEVEREGGPGHRRFIPYAPTGAGLGRTLFDMGAAMEFNPIPEIPIPSLLKPESPGEVADNSQLLPLHPTNIDAIYKAALHASYLAEYFRSFLEEIEAAFAHDTPLENGAFSDPSKVEVTFLDANEEPKLSIPPKQLNHSAKWSKPTYWDLNSLRNTIQMRDREAIIKGMEKTFSKALRSLAHRSDSLPHGSEDRFEYLTRNRIPSGWPVPWFLLKMSPWFINQNQRIPTKKELRDFIVGKVPGTGKASDAKWAKDFTAAGLGLLLRYGHW